MYLFESERLGFRQWLDNDLDPWAALVADPEVMEFFPSTQTREEAAAFIERMRALQAERGFCFWAVEEKVSRDFIGFIGLGAPRFESTFTPCVEIGWRLAKKYWDKGYATEGARACLEYGFRNFGCDSILAFTAIPNKRSERVMQKIGMEYFGNFEHPSVEPGHPLRPHIIYKINNPLKP